AEHEGRRITAGGAAHQTYQTRTTGTDDAADPGRKTEHRAENRWFEFALDDQGRQRDEVPDRKTVDCAGSEQEVDIGSLRDDEEGGRLTHDRDGGGRARIETVDDEAEAEPSDHGHRRGHRDSERRERTAHRRLENRNLMHDEGDLRQQSERER